MKFHSSTNLEKYKKSVTHHSPPLQVQEQNPKLHIKPLLPKSLLSSLSLPIPSLLCLFQNLCCPVTSSTLARVRLWSIRRVVFSSSSDSRDGRSASTSHNGAQSRSGSSAADELREFTSGVDTEHHSGVAVRHLDSLGTVEP